MNVPPHYVFRDDVDTGIFMQPGQLIPITTPNKPELFQNPPLEHLNDAELIELQHFAHANDVPEIRKLISELNSMRARLYIADKTAKNARFAMCIALSVMVTAVVVLIMVIG